MCLRKITMVLTIPSTGTREFSYITRNFRYCRCCGKRSGFSESKLQNGVWPACYSSCIYTTKRRRRELTHVCTPTLTAAVFTLAQSQQNASQLWEETLKTLCWKKANQMARPHTQKPSRTGELTDSWQSWETWRRTDEIIFLKSSISETDTFGNKLLYYVLLYIDYCIMNAINAIER